MRKALQILTFFLAYLIIDGITCTAQHLGSRTELFTIENGLSQTGINRIILDSKGYLWIGTQDGLDRYDGYGFQIFRHQPSDSNSICDNYIRYLCEDHNGYLWLATNNGLSQYNPQTGIFKNFYNDPSDPNSISDNSLYFVYEDHEGDIWIKTIETLEKFDIQKNKFIHYYHYNNVFNYISGDFYFSILEDRDGKLWVGSKDGLNCFDKNLELFERYEYNNDNLSSLSNNSIKALCESNDGKIWIGTENGLTSFDKHNKKFTRFYKKPGNDNSLIDNTINNIFKDSNGLLWISTQNGFCSYESIKGVFKQYSTILLNNAKLSLTGVSSILRDSADILWIGSYQGLVKIDMKPFKFKLYRNFNKNINDLEGLNVSSIYKDEKDNFWLGTWGQGLTVYQNKNNIQINYNSHSHPEFLKDDNIFVLYPDNNNQIWIGTGSGIAIYNKKNEKFTNFCKMNPDCSFLDNNRVYAVFQDTHGIIWIGTEHGLHTYNLKNHILKNNIQIPDSTGIILSSVYCIVEDTSGFIWFGTSRGLIKYNPETGKYKNYLANKKVNIKSLSSNFDYSLLYSSKNTLWVGTTSGLCRYNYQLDDFTIYAENEGLPNNLIYAMLEDNNGNLWLSTNRGLVQFDINLEKFRGFNIADGLQSYEFNIASAFKSKKGELFFGGINGFNSFYPDSLKINNHNPNVEITSIELINQVSLHKMLVWPEKSIHIPSGINIFTISFSGLDFTYPEKNQYMYMMSSKGKESFWVNIGNRHSESFSNLPSGIYTFRIKGSNSDQVWSNKDNEIDIIVESPVWTSNLAIFLYIIFSVTFLYIFMQWRTRKLRQSNKMLRDKEYAAKEIAHQKEELTLKNKNITDSINYAKRIQVAMMPAEKTFKRILPNSFVFHKPRDIVSGDFYWIFERNGKVFVAAVDCTGHGVPGAFMSILGVELFRKITLNEIENPGAILSQLNEDFSLIFSDIEDISLKDGMDISFCVIDKKNNFMDFAGAFNPLYLIRDNKISEIKGNRFSVSMEKKPETLNFTTHRVPLQPKDMIYIFSDGYADQFGGYEGKKFKFRRFRHMLLNIHKMPLDDQKAYLEESIDAWKGTNEQVDDILVIGIKIDFVNS